MTMMPGLQGKQIPRVSKPSREEFERDYLIHEMPVVLTGTIDDWPAREKWTPQYLMEKIGDVPCKMRHSATHKHLDLSSGTQAESLVEDITFGDYLRRTVLSDDQEAARKLYLTGDLTKMFSKGQPNPEFAPLLDDFQLPPYFDRDKLGTGSSWTGVNGLMTWFHYDLNLHHNLTAQVKGRKHFVLVSPNELSKMYPFSIVEDIDLVNFSKVDAQAPDFEKFPKFRDVEFWETVLEEGDMLLIPSAWFHAVDHLGACNINVNFWFKANRLLKNHVNCRTNLLTLFYQNFAKDALEQGQSMPEWLQEEKNLQLFQLAHQLDEGLVNHPNWEQTLNLIPSY